MVRKSSNRVFGATGRRPGVRCGSVACAIHCLARLGPGKTQSRRAWVICRQGMNRANVCAPFGYSR